MSRVIVFLFAALMLALPLSANRSQYAKMRQHAVNMPNNDTAGVAAYSDTTSLARADSLDIDSLAYANGYSRNVNFQLDDASVRSLAKALSSLLGVGAIGVIVAILMAVVGIVSVLAPFVLFGLLIYLIVNHHNEKQRLARAAIMSGQPIPQDMVKKALETPDEQWQRGLKNVFIGLGIVVLCYCLGAYRLAGIGWLVLIYGAGLAVISKTSNRNKHYEDADDKPQGGE
ncbi:MAG: DUF6249 domain-containing protein [Prevotellaceae bacterium]|nr:DUF6249 domain-containing protein [Prevotellaceae bacterium]